MYQKFYDPLFTKIRRAMSGVVEGRNRHAELTPDGKIKLLTQPSISSPWVFLKHGRFRHCGNWQLWHEHFKDVGPHTYIPSGCQNCWKVVIRPQNVMELFQLLDVLRGSDLPSKCGMDVRTWTKQPWGGFIYADSKAQGLDYKDQITPIVRAMISDACADTIHLKRGCTEFDALMPSDQWEMANEHVKLERYLNDMFDHSIPPYNDAEWIIAHKKARWIERANEIGDMSYRAVIGDVDLGVKCITYEREEEVDGKE